MLHLTSISLADDPAVWQRLGFTVRSGRTAVGGVVFQFVPPAEPAASGIVGFDLADDAGTGRCGGDVDGLALRATGDATAFGVEAHANGVERIDHLVVMTPDLERTVAALEAIGLSCRRRRQGASYGQPVHQAFFWLSGEGQVILEVVGPPEVDPAKAGDPARFFGLAFTCRDLDATAAFYGELMKPPVDAVQQGRRIATLSSRAGAAVPLAFMSPHV